MRKYDKLNRIRYNMKSKNSNNYPRCTVYRSVNNIYASIVMNGKIVAYANSLESDFKGKGYNQEGAYLVGKLLGERAKNAGIIQCIFDRGQYQYTGRIEKVAEGIRENIKI